MDDDERLQIWLSRHISRQDAETALKGHPDGTYLIRASVSAPGDYVLCVVCHGQIQHHQVCIKHNNGRMLTRSGRELQNLSELLRHYKTTLDGLEVLLREGTSYFDPPSSAPKGYVNLVHQATVDHDYENTKDLSPTLINKMKAAAVRDSTRRPAPVPQDGAGPNEDVLPTPKGYVNLKKGETGADVVPTPAGDGIPDLVEFEIPQERLQIMSELGSGHYGQVFEAWLMPDPDDFKAQRKKGKLVAVKSLKAHGNDGAVRAFLGEARTLSQFSHPNVLGLLGVVTRSKPWHMITEHIPYGDVRSVLKACRSASTAVHAHEQVYMAAQAAAGMEYLASLGFVHRDLAARNILLGRYCHIKLADFGLSRALDTESQYYVVQSRSLLPFRWMSIEALKEGKFTTQSDVWAFGVLLWEIMSMAKTPWRKNSTQEVKQLILAGERLPPPRNCPQTLYSLMTTCWQPAPAARPTFVTLRRSLEQQGELLNPEKLKPRDIGQFAPRSTSGPSAAMLKFDPEEQSRASNLIEDLQMPRDELIVINELGAGDFYQLVLMEMTSGLTGGAKCHVAAKMLKDNATEADREAFDAEVNLRASELLDHPNVVALIGLCTKDEPPFMVMEYLSLGDLQSYLTASAPAPGQVCPARARRSIPRSFHPLSLSTYEQTSMARDIAAGMSYLAERDIVHRDLAARNCVVGQGPVVKISNFGLGKTLRGGDYYSSSSGVMPVRWMAPEAVCFGKHSCASDVWSFGIVLAEIFTFGEKPFAHMTDLEICNAYASGGMSALPVPPSAPDVIVHCMQECLKGEPKERVSFEQLQEMLDEELSEENVDVDEEPMPLVDDIDWVSGIGEFVHTGWMIKQGSGQGAFSRSSWKRRWFALRDNGTLSYHKAERPDAKPLGTIALGDTIKVHPRPPFELTFAQKSCFSMVTPGRVYNFVCDSDGERDVWIRLLKAAIDALHS
ncbi:uncharacterized protein MONBRDRAFT_44336 [Monosiga brevicollis MX1]|uniref:non-specific protein-tyrosine kinase n=1 Tax=Monosiga brevicollis TaxID=81824 RepID=A9USN6_MONBE|nr:uncharacterized protein MONBRDRAFT_44336 [Monosiga brevicollis MX1]EDQ92133.1 predicted protein [Monosiga brevicollis MX1]|eukprot:XP_001743419.1 hypothetical protein [Monosiga brevicollis MX1]